MLKSGPAYTFDFEEAKKQGITTATSKSGSFAQGFKLRWEKGISTFLPHALRVPQWCYLDDSDHLVFVPTSDSYANTFTVWERVGEYHEEENASAYVHLYYNYMLKQPCFAKARGCGPVIPLLDVQQWDTKPHEITPIFFNCNRWKLKDAVTAELFWKVSALYGLLILNATGVAHLDLSPNNVFKICARTCCVQYKKNWKERIYLPWTPIVTDFDDYSVGWRSASERKLQEKEAVKTLLCKHWTNANFYSKGSRVHEQWLKDVLHKHEATNLEETILYIMKDLQPFLKQHESALRTTTYPESVQHHFNCELYLDDFVAEHKTRLCQVMRQFSVKWKVPHWSISFPYSCETNDDWRHKCRVTESVITMTEVQKRSIDLLLS